MSKPAETQVLFSERVTPKWSNFLPLALILPTFWLTLAPINVLVGVASGVIITVLIAGLMVIKAPMIVISSKEITVGKAQIELKLVGAAVSVPESEAFAARGPKLDARAYVALQPSRKGLIKLDIVDQKDPTPYWLFSTKSPASVLEALSEAKN